MAAVFSALALVWIVVAWSGAAFAQPERAAPTAVSILSKPMLIYLATGPQDICGAGCSEWIAAEGAFTLGVSRRLREFVARQRNKNLPIFFASPGGLQREAMMVGRFLRERRMTVGVWKTVPDGCEKAEDKNCLSLKTASKAVKASLQLGVCNSACVFAIMGGSVREIAPGSKIGVHSGKQIIMRSDGRITEPSQASKKVLMESQASYRKYLQEMGTDLRLLNVIEQTPFERLHVLSRDEIAEFGIDNRRFSETPWLPIVGSPSGRFYVMKFFVEAKGPEHNQYRISGFRLSCEGPQRALVLYFRGLASEEIGRSAKILVVMGAHKVDLSQNGSGRKIDVLDDNGSFGSSVRNVPFEYLEQAVANNSISIAESFPATPAVTSQDRMLSTQGLSETLRVLRDRCASTM